MRAKTPAPLRDASAGALRLPRATKSRMHIEVRIPPESSDCTRSAYMDSSSSASTKGHSGTVDC